MRLQGVRVGELLPSQILELTINGVRESRILEFKRELPGASDEERKEFLADVAALANTSGGVILYGVETTRDAQGRDTGVAESIVGIEATNLDAVQQRLMSLLRDGAQPALARHVTLQLIHFIDEGNSLVVLALGVDSSLDRPHMVTLRGTTRFWRRSEAGKYQPDVPELRRVFLESASWLEECEEFRARRLEVIRQSSTIDGQRAVVVHVLPMGRLKSRIDIRGCGEALNTAFPPLKHSGWNHRYNADGFLTFTPDRSGSILSYTQCFRFGGIEGVSAAFVVDRRLQGSDTTTRVLWGKDFSGVLTSFVTAGVKNLRQVLAVEPPLCLAVSLLGVQGAVLLHDGWHDGHPVDQPQLILPPVVLESESDISVECRGLMDIVWQAAGWNGQPPH